MILSQDTAKTLGEGAGFLLRNQKITLTRQQKRVLSYVELNCAIGLFTGVVMTHDFYNKVLALIFELID